jgi:hypothetical protein
MGSRLMHLIIADKIADHLLVRDKQAFLLGGVAPDAVSPKELSHFYAGDVGHFTRFIDYERFLESYRHHQHRDYIMGYYTHLIADDLWLKGFYLPWLKNRMESDSTILHLYHEDFRLLNGKLADYYRLTPESLRDIEKTKSICDLEEVPIKNVKEFIPHLVNDMDYHPKDLDVPLHVFTFNQIIGYIETSIEKAILHCEKVLIAGNNK